MRGLIASMYIGNAMLLILNLPLVGLFAKVLDLPKSVLMPMVLVFSFLGVWAAGTSTFDVALLAGFGILGYLMRLFDFPPAPLLLSLVLGDLMEQAMRQSLTLSNGDVAIFFTRPISLTLLILSALSVLYPIIRQVREKRRKTAVSA